MTKIQNEAREKFIELLVSGGFSKCQAIKVFDFYREEKIVKFDYVNSRYVVKHGAFMDKQTIKNAIDHVSTTSD